MMPFEVMRLRAAGGRSRLAFAAEFTSTGGSARYWRINTDYTVDGPFSLPFTNPVSIWKRVDGRLYAGNETDGLWYSDDADLATWHQCTGILAKKCSNIVRTTSGWVLIYSATGGNNQYSVSVDGVSFSTLTSPYNLVSTSRAALASIGDTVVTERASSSSAMVSTNAGASFSEVTISSGGLSANDFLAGADGFYRCRAASPLDIRLSASGLSAWNVISTGLNLGVASGTFGIELDEGRVAIFTSVSNPANVGVNVAIGNATDGWTTAQFDPPFQLANSAAPRSPVAFNLDRIMIGMGSFGGLRWLAADLSAQGSITMPGATSATRVTVTS